jgi:hypothetical protein
MHPTAALMLTEAIEAERARTRDRKKVWGPDEGVAPGGRRGRATRFDILRLIRAPLPVAI